MAKFIVKVSWSMAADLEIDAENEDQAKEIAFQELPENGFYLDDSFAVDEVIDNV